MNDPRLSKEQRRERVRQRVKLQFDEDKYEYYPGVEPPDYYNNDVRQLVAIYVRVSTDDPRQTTSFEIQRQYYEEFVTRHPNWVLVGIYAEMLTTTLIQMHPTCTQTAPYLHPEPKAGCICRIFGVFLGCIWVRWVHPPGSPKKRNAHMALRARD